MKFTLLLLLFPYLTYGQGFQYIRGGIREFLDGYAWQPIRDERNPQRGLNFYAFIGNSYLFFLTKNDEGNELESRPPSKAWKIFYVSKPLWSDRFTPVAVSKDSLREDMDIEFNYVEGVPPFAEINYVDFDGNILDTLKTYNGGSSQFIIYKDSPDTIGVVNGAYVSPTLVLDYRRVMEPPKFVQDFIISLKKEVLRPIVKDKSFIHIEPFERTSEYLIKHDEVEILEENDNWLRIRYYGKETIEGWIRKEDVE